MLMLLPLVVLAQPDGNDVRNSRGYGLAARSSDYSHLDWVMRSRLSPQQQHVVNHFCSGGYLEPPRFGLDDQTPLSLSPIYISSLQAFSDQKGMRSELQGEVRINQASLQVQAEHASLNHASNELSLQGEVSIRDRGMLMVGDNGYMQLDSGEMQLDNAEYVVHAEHLRGNARYIKRNDDGIIRLKSGIYTSCSPNRNDWHIKSNQIVLNQETGFGTATNVTMRIKNVPVFYTPFISFPIDDRRQSGFLPPSISYSDNHGINVTTPYYINLAPNYDATLYPNYSDRHGLHTETELRYLSRNSRGMLGGAWLGDDQDRKRAKQSHYREDRWLYHWQHDYGYNRRLLTQVDYTEISDPYYFQDFSSNLLQSTSGSQDTDRTVDQKASATWRGDSYQAVLGVHGYRRANVSYITPYDRLPYIQLNGAVPGEWGGLRLDYQAQWTYFDRHLDDSKFYDRDGLEQERVDAMQVGLNRVNGGRLHLEPGLSLPMRASWGFLEPKAKLAYTSYHLDLEQVEAQYRPNLSKSPSRAVPLYSLDGGLYFDRPTNLFGKNYTQTLEPRLFYLYVPYRDQRDIPLFDSSETSFGYSSLFRDNRFTGKDRVGDTNQLSTTLTYRWLEESGFERQRLALGQIHYFRDRRVLLSSDPRRPRNPATENDYLKSRANTRKKSPYTGQYMYRFGYDWSVTADMTWDQEAKKTTSGQLALHYQPEDEPGKIFNLAYRYRDDGVFFNENTGRWEIRQARDSSGNVVSNPDKIVQSDMSFMWPISQRWSALGRWQYDHHTGRTLDAFGGVEYTNCCWSARIVQRYWLDHDEQSQLVLNNVEADRGIFLQFVFRGLGGASIRKLETFLDEGIQGYQKREQSKPF